MQLRAGEDAEQLDFFCDKTRLLEKLPLCRVLDPFVNLDGAAAGAPAVVVGAQLQQHPALGVFDDDACAHLDQGPVADNFS